ncbi:MAG: hypothetical protein KAJ51_04400 [Thermoplasmata archaeon]|nr:hypothetical protein [Thermoplasmata archaeon]
MEYCPLCDGELELTLRKKDKWYCRNCNKYFLQVPADEPEPLRESHYSKSRVITVIFIVVIVLLGVIACIYIATPVKKTNEEENEGDNGGPLNIISVTYTPQDPQADDEIVVTAEIENCAGASLRYSTYFAGGGSGGRTMSRVEDGIYEDELRPFDDGTEIWVIVKARDTNGNFQISDELIIQVGEIERSGISSLSISNIGYNPRTPTPADVGVKTWATITSDREITYVHFCSMRFYLEGSGSSSGTTRDDDGDNIFEEFAHLDGGLPVGAKVYFKFAAQDESGNTAVSATYKLTIS